MVVIHPGWKIRAHWHRHGYVYLEAILCLLTQTFLKQAQTNIKSDTYISMCTHKYCL